MMPLLPSYVFHPKHKGVTRHWTVETDKEGRPYVALHACSSDREAWLNAELSCRAWRKHFRGLGNEQ